jgi:hypothetical protein
MRGCLHTDSQTVTQVTVLSTPGSDHHKAERIAAVCDGPGTRVPVPVG